MCPVAMTESTATVNLGSYHRSVLPNNKSSKFCFYAFNLSTGQTLPVTSRGNVLSICMEDVQFAPHGGESENKLVSELRDLIDDGTRAQGTASGQNEVTTQENSQCATRFRQCLRSILSLYSDCTNNVHDVAFIELTFSIEDAPEFSNSFAAVVPVICKNGVVSTMLPFHGSLWEEPMSNQSKCFIQSSVIPDTLNCDTRVTQLRKVFRDRVIMMSGKLLLKPFINIESGRETRPKLKRAEYMILRQNTETYVSLLYGTLVSIGRSHELMTEHEMCMLIVQNVILTAVVIFGHDSRVSSQELINNFFSILCYSMHLGQLGNRSYRVDLIGEDIRKR